MSIAGTYGNSQIIKEPERERVDQVRGDDCVGDREEEGANPSRLFSTRALRVLSQAHADRAAGPEGELIEYFYILC